MTCITIAPDGALWFGTSNWLLAEGHGLSRFDGKSWTSYTSANGLANNEVQSIAVAPDGALWFGTMGGVSRYSPPD